MRLTFSANRRALLEWRAHPLLRFSRVVLSGEREVRRICVDMDEVMADTLSEHIRRYNQTFDEAVTTEDLAGKGLWEITPLDRQAQLRAFLDAEDFFEDLPLMPGAQSVLNVLSSRFEIFIATQAMAVPNSLGPK